MKFSEVRGEILGIAGLLFQEMETYAIEKNIGFAGAIGFKFDGEFFVKATEACCAGMIQYPTDLHEDQLYKRCIDVLSEGKPNYLGSFSGRIKSIPDLRICFVTLDLLDIGNDAHRRKYHEWVDKYFPVQ